MGLNFRNSNAQWSYGGFNRFRERLAAEIGINLREMEGFVDGGLSWKKIKDPIAPFLNHSDCDGDLSPEQCATVAPRLRELVDGWDDDHDKRNALELAKDMKIHAAASKPLVFF